MVDLGKFSVKELSNEGVDFHLVDDFGIIVEPGEQVPIKFTIYGADSSRATKAKREYSAVLDAKNVKPHKAEEAGLKFVCACVKSWEDFAMNGKTIKNGDTEALSEFFGECPMFRDQIIEFVFERDHFLAK
jgi:hypothetical protein